MVKFIFLFVLFLGFTYFSSGQTKTRPQTAASMMREKLENEANPLLADWSGAFGGLPPFHLVKVEYFKPAFTKAMALYEAEIQSIAENPEKPGFENTLEAMEKAGKKYAQIRAIYGVWSSNMNSPEFEKVEAEMEPQLAAFQDKIFQNQNLFLRIEALYQSDLAKTFKPEQKRLLEKRYRQFVLAGAKLDEETKTKVSELNQLLAGKYTRFSQNLLADENEKYLELKQESDLAGLPQNLKESAARAAEARGMKGLWVINNTRSSLEPFLEFCDNRELREKAWRMFVNRGDNQDANDNNALITEILSLRAQKAKLLGFETHAHWRLQNTMAKTPEKAMELMLNVWKPACELVQREVADMQAIADQEGKGIKIEPWDYRYFAEKVRKSKYNLDQNEVKPYMQLEKLKQGMFWVAGELFGLQFKPLKDIPVFHPDVLVYEVIQKEKQKTIGLWYFDPYARKGKRSGAWMTSYRDQSRMNGKPVLTLVSNNSNFIKGKPGEPVLISWDDAETLFHEFGHALHGLCSDVTYPSLSGTSVPQDYVEFPSQILERWLATPEVLGKFALHFETGKPIPGELVKKIEAARKFNQGFSTVEATSSALVDMKLHLAGDQKIDPDQFEKQTLEELGMPKEMVMRHRCPQFSHIFSGDEYSAGYYSYLWSDVISADAYEAFTGAGGPYDKAVAKRLYDFVFSIGDTMDQSEAYRKFRGSDPKTDALMKNRGL
jgi:peptidyl-dipeptidase Dcp